MVRRFLSGPLLGLAIIAGSFSVADAQKSTYKEYRRSIRTKNLFEVSFNKRSIEITLFEEDRTAQAAYQRRDLSITRGQVRGGAHIIFDQDELVIDGQKVSLGEVYDTRVGRTDGYTAVTFLARTQDIGRVSRVKRGNVIRPHRNITIDEDRFVRGLLFTVTGDIEVMGEVNRDVISLFGNIYVGPEAVIRGDIVSVTGKVTVSDRATVYGRTYTGRHRGRVHRRWTVESHSDIKPRFTYNRVDGARVGQSLQHTDALGYLPSVEVSADYAFESERWRFGIGVEQPILRRPDISIGAEFYRRLASEDDWLLGDCENTVFALLVTEDFKDYYEAEGASAYITARPMRNLRLETRYRQEETNWLPSQPHLFSLFGGDKLFSPNFRRVDSVFRDIGIAMIDTTTLAGLTATVTYDTRGSNPFRRSAWLADGRIEWSHPDLGSDFDYRRYTLRGSRYQRLTRRSMIIGQAMFGGSDGYLPMHKRFYLGGLGTLRGFKHKEFMGTRFWMANFEYRFRFPASDLALSLLWDAAQITNDVKFQETDEVKHSLGIAIYLGDDLRISLAKRLDRSAETDPNFYARVDHAF
ncbi:MAG: BamA/TamA family outer membrane protein [Candidatus Zixiibacteriota bacterium]|nr:MAG: BamA/TamA family outer membrane protein [candidate division Zixibacteria bacterium]